jgi:uncharacterized RDD family membrane protein YckC
MPSTRVSSFCALVFALFACVSAWGAPATRPAIEDVLITAARGDKQLWVAEVSMPDGEAVTALWYRLELGRSWRASKSVPARVVALAAAGDDNVAALLAGGAWQYLGLATGAALPEGAEMKVLAREGDSLISLGRRTEPADGGYVLYRLQRGEWNQVAALPPDEGDVLALAAVSGGITVARGETTSDGKAPAVRVWRYQGDAWQRVDVALPQPPARARLLEINGELTLWVRTANDVGALYSVSRPASPVPLAGNAKFADAAVVGSELLVVSSDGDAYSLRQFDPATGAVLKEVTPLKLPRVGEPPKWVTYTHTTMFAVLVIILTVNLFRRRDQVPLKLDWQKVRVAPLGRRLVAGMIDGIPMLVGATWLAAHYPDLEMQDMATNPELTVATFIISSAYLLLVTLAETLLGRSPGKMVMGLRIVRFDGASAGRGQLLVRNLLRAIDLWMFVPLILIVILPLRQRLGDVAAGTVVVKDAPAQTAPGGAA